MSFTSQIARNDYIGNGFISTYDYLFKVFSDTHIVVLVQDLNGNETSLPLYAGFTVQGVGRATGGTITLVGGPLTAGYRLAIIRQVPLGQPTDLRNQGGYYPETVEDQLDRLAMVDMWLRDLIRHSVTVPLSLDVANLDLELPTPEPELAIGWNQDGTALVNLSTLPGFSDEAFVPINGSRAMSGPLSIFGSAAGIFIGDRNVSASPAWPDWSFFAEDGILHWQANGVDRATLGPTGLTLAGRIFGNAGGIGLGRVTCSTEPPPADGQEGDLHFQF